MIADFLAHPDQAIPSENGLAEPLLANHRYFQLMSRLQRPCLKHVLTLSPCTGKLGSKDPFRRPSITIGGSQLINQKLQKLIHLCLVGDNKIDRPRLGLDGYAVPAEERQIMLELPLAKRVNVLAHGPESRVEAAEEEAGDVC